MLKIQCITIDSADPIVPARFWSAALDWPITFSNEIEVAVEDPNGGADLLFIKTSDKRVTKNRVHLDLRPDDQDAEVSRLETLGAKHIEIGQSADSNTSWIVMADPDGNEFCVLKSRAAN